LLYIILFFFTGCFAVMEFKKETPEKISAGTTEKNPESAETFLSSSYQRKSLEYEKKNELQMALYYMQIAGSLNPDDKIIAKRIAVLESTIANNARQHFKKGVVYFKKNNLKYARMQFLITLRYNPDHKGALDYLKNRLAPKEYIIYKTKKGDTLKSISRKFYDDYKKDFLIVYFNNLETNKNPAPGTTLKLLMTKSYFTHLAVLIRNDLIKARNLLEEERYEEVLKIAGEVLKYDLMNKEAADLKNAAYYHMGMQLSREEKYPEAINTFKKVDPKYKDVKKAIREVINKDLMKASNLLREDQYEEVLALAEKALAYDKSNKVAKDLISTTYCQKGRGLITQKNYVEALKVLNKADPLHDCIEKAISDVKGVMKKKAEAHYLQGVKYFLNQELSSAIIEWEKTLVLNPDHKKAKENIINARRLLEKYKKVE
jgi:tetratricopeptide (TPR) repeat protein